METGRGKKGKNTAWHLTLGLTEVILACFGMIGLMCFSFTIGTLAGRGDIYRAAYSWGLLSPEPKAISQVLPQVAAAPAAPVPAAAAPAANAGSLSLATLPGGPAVPHATPAKVAHTTPVAANLAQLPAPAATASIKKKSKAAQARREQLAREEQLHRERLEIASKLTFQNSLDSTPRLKKEKTAAKTMPTLVKVGTFRDSKTAHVKMAELQKKGAKVTLKQGKDAKGVFYTLYRQNPAAPAENLAQKKEKPSNSGASRKTHN